MFALYKPSVTNKFVKFTPVSVYALSRDGNKSKTLLEY